MRSTNLRDAWLSWIKSVLPADAPRVQREECFRAFMCGAAMGQKFVSEGIDFRHELNLFFAACDVAQPTDSIEEMVLGTNENWSAK